MQYISVAKRQTCLRSPPPEGFCRSTVPLASGYRPAERRRGATWPLQDLVVL